jgi:hypothetical protein
MTRLEVGQYWLPKLRRTMPDASTRMTIRMAWHLAGLDIQTEEDLANLQEAALVMFRGGHRHFAELRSTYLRRIHNPAHSTHGIQRLVRHSAKAQ